MDDKTPAAAASGTASKDAASEATDEAPASGEGMRSLLAAAMGLTRLHDGPESGGAGEDTKQTTPTAKVDEAAPSQADAEAKHTDEAPFGLRSPDEIVAARRATPLALSRFAAAVLERGGLDPLVLLFDDHAVVGTWLSEQGFVDATVDEVLRLEKRRELGSIALLGPDAAFAPTQ